MRHLISILCLAVAVIVLTGKSTEALPPFKKAFDTKYTKQIDNEEFKAAAKKAGCNLCHVKGEKDKKKKNAYGQLLDELIEGNAKARLKKDKEAVMKELEQAFDKVECEKADGDKTWKDLFKAGKVPDPVEPKK